MEKDNKRYVNIDASADNLPESTELESINNIRDLAEGQIVRYRLGEDRPWIIGKIGKRNSGEVYINDPLQENDTHSRTCMSNQWLKEGAEVNILDIDTLEKIRREVQFSFEIFNR